MHKPAILQIMKVVSLASTLALSSLVLAAGPDIPMSRSGAVTQVSPEDNEIIISGRTYELPGETVVFLDDQRIDATDIQEGMLVSFAIKSGTSNEKVPTIQAIKVLSGGKEVLQR
ncbi:MAG: hypothetical protein R3F37_02960 [Candidatus Competibacteraceae bacterium]